MSHNDKEEFERTLDGSLDTIEEHLKVRGAALNRKEIERQDFLSSFRDIAQNVILPQMHLAKKHERPAVLFTIHEGDESVSLVLSIREKPEPIIQVPCSISYQADWKRKRIVLMVQGTERKVFLPSEITEAGVREDINKMVASARPGA